MKTKIMIIMSAIILIIAVIPCAARKINKNSRSNMAYQYELLPMAPVLSNINLSWEIDYSKTSPHPCITYTEANSFSVMVYGLVDYSFGNSKPYTLVEDVVIYLEYRTTDLSISLDPSMIKADVIRFIAETEGISDNEVQTFSFAMSARVKGIAEEIAQKKKAKLNSGDTMTLMAQEEAGSQAAEIKSSVPESEAQYSEPVSVFKMSYSAAPRND